MSAQTSASDDRKLPGETLAEAPSTPHDAYESGRKAALEQRHAAEAQQPYWFYAGQTFGGVVACSALRACSDGSQRDGLGVSFGLLC